MRRARQLFAVLILADAALNTAWRRSWPWWDLVSWQLCTAIWVCSYLFLQRVIDLQEETIGLLRASRDMLRDRLGLGG